MTNREIQIERADALDAAPIAEINETIPDENWDAANAARFLQNPDNLLLLARCDGRVCGIAYSHLLQLPDTRGVEVLLYSLGVREDFRRRGVGRQLVEATKHWASQRGAGEVWVATERSNTAAIALYQSTGGVEDPPDATIFVFTVD